MAPWRYAVALALLVAAPSLAESQPADDENETAPRRLSVSFGGEVTGTYSAEDDGWFNFTDYNTSLTRLATAALNGAVHLNDHVEILGEFRVRNRNATASGLYVRVRPWTGSRFALQAGRIPPVFGRFSRRGYGGDNPLIGTPLSYQYLTTLRSTEVPYGVDSLLEVRGRGWLVNYPSYVNAWDDYERHPGAGLPLVSATRWDTGIQAHYERSGVGASVAVTTGSLSNPRVDDDNDGRQVAARGTWQPVPLLQVGGSFARGAFLSRDVVSHLPERLRSREYTQQAWGVDAEVSAGYWAVRGEAIVSRWRLPALGTVPIDDPVRATALTLEARYRLTPRLHVAARGERLLFSDLTGSLRSRATMPWDAPVSRVEIGTGYALHRQVLAKIAWQYNWRDGITRPLPREGFLAVQVAAWF